MWVPISLCQDFSAFCSADSNALSMKGHQQRRLEKESILVIVCKQSSYLEMLYKKENNNNVNTKSGDKVS